MVYIAPNRDGFNRGFVVPLEKGVPLERLTKFEFVGLKDEYFTKFWRIGFFEHLNDELDSMIDGCDDEEIKFELLSKLKSSIKNFELVDTFSIEEKKVIEELLSLCERAIELKSSLYFVL